MDWLDRRSLPFAPKAPDPSTALAVRAWNMLGGLEWNGIETVTEVLGIEDVETLIVQLALLRDNLDGSND